jgi:hypothetical protein
MWMLSNFLSNVAVSVKQLPLLLGTWHAFQAMQCIYENLSMLEKVLALALQRLEAQLECLILVLTSA